MFDHAFLILVEECKHVSHNANNESRINEPTFHFEKVRLALGGRSCNGGYGRSHVRIVVEHGQKRVVLQVQLSGVRRGVAPVVTERDALAEFAVENVVRLCVCVCVCVCACVRVACV